MFKINVHRVGNHTFIVCLRGQLTAAASREVQRALLPILKKDPKAVSINLDDVDTMDEAGIALIMNGLTGIWNRGTYFYVVGLPKKIRDYYQACSEEMGHPFSSRTTH